MKKFVLLGLLICLFVPRAWSQDITLSNGTKVTQEQLRKIAEKLPTLQEDKVFYHWTSQETGIRWIAQSYVNEGEVAFYNKPTGNLQVYGPGIYLADSPTSSRTFGELPVAFKIRKGTLLYDDKVVSEVLKVNLTAADKSILGEHIPFVRKVTEQGWYLTNHPKNTAELSYAGLQAKEASLYFNDDDPRKKPTSTVLGSTRFKELISNGDQDAIYLSRILNLSDYMDGISFARAMKVNPGNPWDEFKNGNFEQYQRALSELPEKTKDLFKGGEAAIRKTLISELLPAVYGSISGNNNPKLDDIVRVEGIRAGGSDPGETFLLGKDQLEELKKNPYLQVVAQDQGNGKYLVHYFYPDAFHYQHLKGKISDALYEKLQKINPDHLMGNHDLRKSLNKQMILELMKDLEANIGTRPLHLVLEDLVSIHPFGDFNGRSIRMMDKLMSYNGIATREIRNTRNRHYFMSDMDIFLPADPENKLVLQGSVAHQNLQKDLIEELLIAKSQKRMPDYLKTGAFEKYAAASMPAGVLLDLGDHAQLEMIRQRQWTQLLEDGESKYWLNIEKMILQESTRAKGMETLLSGDKQSVFKKFGKDAQLIVLQHMSKRLSLTTTFKEQFALARKYIEFSNAVTDAFVLEKMPSHKSILNDLIRFYKEPRYANTRHAVLGETYLLPISNETKLAVLYKNFFNDAVAPVKDGAFAMINHLLDQMGADPKWISTLRKSEQEDLFQLLKKMGDDNVGQVKPDFSQKVYKLYADMLPHAHADVVTSAKCVTGALKSLLQKVK